MKRYPYEALLELALTRKKMAFISGPRQVGKTTLSKSYLTEFDKASYCNWDETLFRRLWTKSPNELKNHFDLTKTQEKRLLILDEIHKAKGWKQKLKGLYDDFGEDVAIIVTGSARLNVFQKGSDSLMGRYLNFRLYPLSYGEVTKNKPLSPENWLLSLFNKSSKKVLAQEPLTQLLKMSGFPEPYFANSEKILNVWRRGRNEKIIREDLRDLSRLPELSQIEMLASLLPTKVGSPLNVQSLREDLEVAHDTVSRWLRYLNELFYFFELKPWSKSIPRTLKKEGKIYLYDWTEIEDKGAQFENLVALHLLKACHYWTDTGEGTFELFYLRNKEKQELDFLIVRNKKPWVCFESKVSDTKIDTKVVDKFTSYLNVPFVQIVFQPDIWKVEGQRLVASANRIFVDLP